MIAMQDNVEEQMGRQRGRSRYDASGPSPIDDIEMGMSSGDRRFHLFISLSRD